VGAVREGNRPFFERLELSWQATPNYSFVSIHSTLRRSRLLLCASMTARIVRSAVRSYLQRCFLLNRVPHVGVEAAISPRSVFTLDSARPPDLVCPQLFASLPQPDPNLCLEDIDLPQPRLLRIHSILHKTIPWSHESKNAAPAHTQ